MWYNETIHTVASDIGNNNGIIIIIIMGSKANFNCDGPKVKISFLLQCEWALTAALIVGMGYIPILLGNVVGSSGVNRPKQLFTGPREGIATFTISIPQMNSMVTYIKQVWTRHQIFVHKRLVVPPSEIYLKTGNYETS